MTPASDSATETLVREAAASWCIKLMSGPLSADEQAALDHWLAANPAGDEYLQGQLAAWRALDAASETPEVVSYRAEALDQMRRANRRRWRRRPGRFWYYAASAAAVLTGIIGVGLLHRDQATTRSISTGVGERRTLLLADGSQLSLDASSRVSVTMSDGRRQLVLGAGRAKFDVAHDERRPFTVQAGGTTVRATGTSFSTEMLNGKLHVILYRGHVTVGDRETVSGERGFLAPGTRAWSIALQPGQEFVGDAGQIGGVVGVDPPRSLSWERGLLDFNDEPLADAVAQFNRYSPDTIVVRGAAGEIRVSGVFEAGKSRSFIEAISEVYPVKVTQRSNNQFDVSM